MWILGLVENDCCCKACLSSVTNNVGLVYNPSDIPAGLPHRSYFHTPLPASLRAGRFPTSVCLTASKHDWFRFPRSLSPNSDFRCEVTCFHSSLDSWSSVWQLSSFGSSILIWQWTFSFSLPWEHRGALRQMEDIQFLSLGFRLLADGLCGFELSLD